MIASAPVEALLRRVAAAEIMPRFRHLTAADQREKGPGDLVTIADEAAEAALAPALLALLPGSAVVGEEACARDPELLAILSRPEPVWLIDPIDGTLNFAGGDENFVSMLALVRADRVIGSWIYHPPSGMLTSFTPDEGLRQGGQAIPARQPSAAATDAAGVKGVLAYGVRGAPDIARQVEARRHRLTQVKSRRCAGLDYIRLALGEIDFAFFSGVMPWDHAPGAGLLAGMGGHIADIHSDSYRPSAARHLKGILAARDRAIWRHVHSHLFGMESAS